MRFDLKMLVVPALAGLSMIAPAQEGEVAGPNQLAVEVGWYMPSDGLIRDRFGNNIFRIGVAGLRNKYVPQWTLAYDINFVSASEDGNRFLLVPLTIGFQKSLGQPNTEVNPYVRAGVGLSFMNWDIDGDDGSAVGGTASVELGAYFGDRFRVAARYNLFTKADDFNFNGLQFTVAYGLFKF